MLGILFLLLVGGRGFQAQEKDSETPIPIPSPTNQVTQGICRGPISDPHRLLLQSLQASTIPACLTMWVVFLLCSPYPWVLISLFPLLWGALPAWPWLPETHALGSLHLLPLVAGWQSFNDNWARHWPMTIAEHKNHLFIALRLAQSCLVLSRVSGQSCFCLLAIQAMSGEVGTSAPKTSASPLPQNVLEKGRPKSKDSVSALMSYSHC